MGERPQSDTTTPEGRTRSYLVLAVLLLAAFGALFWPQTAHLLAGDMIRLAVLLVTLVVWRRLFMAPSPASTSAGAIVMACGIFINGAIVRFPFLDHRLARGLALLVLAVWALIAWEYVKSLVEGTLAERHLSDPVGVFAVGTWVAGTSVCGVALSHRLPDWVPFFRVLLGLNIVLWGFYLVHAVGSFIVLLLGKGWKKAHGVLLLSTVSTQSIVILTVDAWGHTPLIDAAARVVILIGAIFYVTALAMIGLRYLSVLRSVDLSQDWTNTNCIIHGAMSITGLASCVSGVVPARLVLIVWLWALAWFVIVEAIEVLRMIARTGRMGLMRAIWVYSPTQWARNFTFGMLYAFTLNFHLGTLGGTGAGRGVLVLLRTGILRYGAWVVLAVLVYEIFLGLSSSFSMRRAAR